MQEVRRVQVFLWAYQGLFSTLSAAKSITTFTISSLQINVIIYVIFTRSITKQLNWIVANATMSRKLLYLFVRRL